MAKNSYRVTKKRPAGVLGAKGKDGITEHEGCMSQMEKEKIIKEGRVTRKQFARRKDLPKRN